jgi:hypothetical protein
MAVPAQRKALRREGQQFAGIERGERDDHERQQQKTVRRGDETEEQRTPRPRPEFRGASGHR